MSIKSVSSMLAVAGCMMSFGANFPQGTYIYTGTVLDYRHEAKTSADGLVIQAVATNGTVLAASRVTDPVISTGVNFVLEVPVSTKASPKSAAIGDEMNCVLVSSGGVTNVSPRPLPRVAAANAITNVNVVSAPAKAFAFGEGQVLVADEYLDMIAPLMEEAGYGAYDPAADWDGDGASNYSEYLAGTNPFLASDRLRVIDFQAGGETTLLTFEYAGGHLYALDSSPALTNRTWSVEPFRVDDASAAEQRTVLLPGTEDENVGVMTLHLTPAAASPSMFYRLRAE